MDIEVWRKPVEITREQFSVYFVVQRFKGTFEQATCGSDAECVPDELVKSGSKVELKKCTGVLGSEGRCF